MVGFVTTDTVQKTVGTRKWSVQTAKVTFQIGKYITFYTLD